MGNPITWQNVNGPSQGNPAQFMQLATNGIDNAFSSLQGVLKQQEDTNKANWDQGAVNNAEALKSALYGARTPAEMQALQQSGQLNTMLTGYGAQVKDPNALRALMDGRLSALQGQATAGITYDNTVADQNNAPKLEEYRTASPARQAEIVAQNPGMRGLGAVVQETQKFGFERDKAEAAKLLAPLTRGLTQAQTTNANASANQSNASAEASRATSGDATLLKNFTTKAAEAAVEYSRKVDTVYKDHGVLAKSLGMPMLPSGIMDRSRMTADQVAAVDDLAQKSGLPSWKNMPDESAGVRAFGEQAIKEGTPASVVLSSQKAIGEMFGSANLATESGAGRAAAKERENKATEKLKAEILANGPAGEGSTNAVRNSDAVIKHIESVTTKDSSDREKLMKFVLSEMGKTTKINGQEVGYPLGLIKQAINETAGKDGWIGNWRGENTRDRMQELMKTPEYQKAIADRADLESRLLLSDTASTGGGKAGNKPKAAPSLTDRQKKARSILGLD